MTVLGRSLGWRGLMGPLCPQGRFPLSRVDIISSKLLPARGLLGPSLPVVPAPPRLASGCQSGVAACCLASPLRRRGPPGLPVCRSGCAGPAAVACPLPPSRMRGMGTTGCCSELSSLHIGALPLLPCRGPCEAREWRGPGVALRSRPWREPVSHGQHPPFTTRICWVEISLVC